MAGEPALPADHSWEGDEDGHNCTVCVERGDTLNMCWRENHLSIQGENRVVFAKMIGEATGITDPERLLRLADAVIADLVTTSTADRCPWSYDYDDGNSGIARCALKIGHGGDCDPQRHGFGKFNRRDRMAFVAEQSGSTPSPQDQGAGK